MSSCFYQRKRRAFAILLSILLLFCLFSGCSKKGASFEFGTRKNGLYINFIDVGQGDCTLIMFPDGKNMLIDCGDGSDFAVKNIKNILNGFSVKKLDYLVLTHPDLDHVGGALSVLKTCSVNKAYLPKILDLTPYEEYSSVLQRLKDKNANVLTSQLGVCIKGEDYSVAFLSPKPYGQTDSSYTDFNTSNPATSEQINDISPMIYLEYNGVRFLFTGDAGVKEERKLIDDYNSSLIKNTFDFYGISVELENIDFLKVSHHGADDASSQDFLNLLTAGNAVISVGGNNIYGHPSIYTQSRLLAANQDCNLLRTDLLGTISVCVLTDGEMQIKTQKRN